MLRAMSVALPRSSCAPVETSPKISSSAARPPSSIAILFSSSLSVIRKRSSVGQLHRVAERRDAARDDRDLVHRVRARQRDATSACPARGRRPSPSRAVTDAGPLLRPATTRSMASCSSTWPTSSLAAAHAEQRRLVDDVRQVGADEPGGHAPRCSSRSTPGASVTLRACTSRISQPRRLVGPIDQHLAIEAARPQQRRVEDLGPVGRGHQDDALRACRSRPARPAAGSASARAPRAPTGPTPRALPSASSSSMKMMQGAFFLRLLEQVAHARRADADEHLDEVRAADREERHAGLARDGAREQRLAGAGRPDEQDALRACFAPRRPKRSGVFRKSTTSSSSSLASSMPATSAKRTLTSFSM